MKSRDERGAAATELVILVPGVLLVVMLLVAGARIWFARATVTDAAQSAARSGSLARTPGQASADAELSVRGTLDRAGLSCVGSDIRVDAAALATPAGTPGRVDVAVTCDVSMTDLVGLGLPGHVSVRADSSSVVDTYRRRG